MLSMVLVASLLLSMVIVSGLSVSAANARVHYITGDDILYSGNDIGCIPADLTTEGNSWTLSLTGNCNTTAGSVVAAVILGDPNVLQDLPYLVIDVDESSTLNNSWLAWSETSGYVWPFGSWGANTGLMAAVSDRDTIIALHGVPKRELMDRPNSAELDRLMEQRKNYRYEAGASRIPASESSEKYHLGVAAPILSQGDLMGCVMLLLNEGDSPLAEGEQKLVQTAAAFLGKQMES